MKKKVLAFLMVLAMMVCMATVASAEKEVVLTY